MDREQCCRLCMAPNTYDHLSIFSAIGIEMKLSEIISEHFKCEVSELDPLPNLICQTCWKTTESFHELYQRSRIVEETFLSSPIKVEPDETELVTDHEETNFVEELQIEDGSIKPEPGLDDSDANDDVEMAYDANTIDSDEQSADEEAKGPKINSITATEVIAAKKKKKSRKAMRQSKAERDRKFDEFLSEHKHRLKMDCDLCSTVFENLQEARDHYAKQHNTAGYLKCCSAKLYFPSHVVDHINHHVDPKSSKPKHKPKEFSCNICSKSFATNKILTAHKRAHEEIDEADNDEYLKFMNEHFDMKCDYCDTIFRGFYDSIEHYKAFHSDVEKRGYVKCCDTKLETKNLVRDHIRSHLEPDIFKCNECGKICTSQPQLARHKYFHAKTKNKSLICDYCNHAFRDKASLKKHMLAKHLREPKPPKPKKQRPKFFPCNICSKSFITKTKLNVHSKMHKENREAENDEYLKFMIEHFDMKCDLCEAVFSGFWDAREHYREIHNKNKGYIKCCSIKLKEEFLVRDHIKSHFEPEIFKCNICSKSCATRIHFEKHKQGHYLTNARLFICDYCKSAHRDKEQILRHFFTKHSFVKAKFKCELCPKKFQLALLLKTHMYAAHREKKFVGTCEICGRSFSTRHSLAAHKIQHVDKSERLIERKQCEHCGEFIATKSGVFYHKQKHESGPQTCEHCRLELPNRVSLLGHIRQHHRDHKYSCSYCPKTFSIKYLAKKHEESHTRHKTYPCLFCPKIFSLYQSLSTHVARTHPQEQKRSAEMKKLKNIAKSNKDE